MLPTLVAIVEALFYLFNVPVCVALAVDDKTGLRVGTGMSAFAGRPARRRALRSLMAPGTKKPGPRPGQVWAVLRRLRIRRLEVSGRVALGDAAATALCCGLLTGAVCGLRGRAAAFRADVRPDFSNDFRVELRGMLTARAGDIMIAVLFGRQRGRIGKE